MQRYIAGILVFLMLGQTSGAAIAGTSSAPGQSFDLARFIKPLESAIALTSRLYAVASGTEDRYGAMHAPAPVITRPVANVDASRLVHDQRPLRPVIRRGIPSAFDPADA